MKKDKPAFPGSLMSKKEHKASMAEFNKRPGEMEKLKEIKKKRQVITKGSRSPRHSKEDLSKAHAHMKKHGG